MAQGAHFSSDHSNPISVEVPAPGKIAKGHCCARRPLGFPHGIVFGAKFIQIGQFRLAALDDDHLSISHQNGWTNRLFVGHNGHIVDRPGGGHDWNAWRHLAGGDESFRKGLSAGIAGVGLWGQIFANRPLPHRGGGV